MTSNYINVWYVHKESLPSITYYVVKIVQPTQAVNGPLRDYIYLIRQKIFEYLTNNTGGKTYDQVKGATESSLLSKFRFYEYEFQKAILKLYMKNVIILTNTAKGSLKDVYSDTSYVNPDVRAYLVDSSTRYQLNNQIVFYEDDYLGNFDYSVGEVSMKSVNDLGLVSSINSYVFDLNYDNLGYNPRGFRSIGSRQNLYIGEGQTSTNDGSSIIMATYTRAGNVITVTSPENLDSDLVDKTLYLEFTSNVFVTASYTRSGTTVTVTLDAHKYPGNSVVLLKYSDNVTRSYRVNSNPTDNQFSVDDLPIDYVALGFTGGELKVQRSIYIVQPPKGDYVVISQENRKVFTVIDPNISTGDSTYDITSPPVVIIRNNLADVSYIEFNVGENVVAKRILAKPNPLWDPTISNEQISLNPENLELPPMYTAVKLDPPKARDLLKSKFELDPLTESPVMMYYDPDPLMERSEHVIKVYGSLERALQEARLNVNSSSINGKQIESAVGTYFKYHPNGYVAQEYTYKLVDGVSFPIGTFIEYHPNGELRCQGNFSLTNENKTCTYAVDQVQGTATILNLPDHIIQPKDAIRFSLNDITLSLRVKGVGSSSLFFKIPYYFEAPSSGTATLMYSIRLMGRNIPINIVCRYTTNNTTKEMVLSGVVYPVITYPKNSKRLAKVPRAVDDYVKIAINTGTLILPIDSVPTTSSVVIKLPEIVTLPTSGSATITTYSSVMDGQYFEYYLSGAIKSRCNIVRGRVQGDVYQWDDEGNREYIVLGIQDGTFTENTVVLNYTFTY